MTNVQTIKSPAGEEMVVLPKAEYDLLLAAARETLEDDLDIREANRILARLESGEEETLPFEVVKRLRTENRIKVLREHRGMTQKELAAAAGTNPFYLSQIETGRAIGGVRKLGAIAKALGVSLDLIAPPIKEGVPVLKTVPTKHPVYGEGFTIVPDRKAAPGRKPSKRKR